MAHALAAFIQKRMDEKRLRQRDVVATSGLSRALVSKYVADDRDKLGRLPARETLEGLARALGVPIDVLIGKAVEALGLGYTSGDFINSVATASNRELLDEIEDRLAEGGEGNAGSTPSTSEPDVEQTDVTKIVRQDWDGPDEEGAPIAARSTSNPKQRRRGPREQRPD